MSLRGGSRLRQGRQSQLLGGCKTQRVAVVAEMPMCAPGPSGNAPLMMSREAAHFAHKTKRGLLCQPGKPLGGIGLKREQTLLGADHHIVSSAPIFDAREDMSRLAGGLGCRRGGGTSARSRGRRPG